MKLFISGTSEDLRTYRVAVAGQLGKMDVTPDEQSYSFGVDYRTLTEFLTKEIKACDAVICLVGKVYGAEPSHQQTEPRRSYTQMEYYTARDLGKPVFVFFPAAECKLDGEGHDLADQATLQAAHVQAIKDAGHKWEEFQTGEQLCRLTAEVVYRISPEAADAQLGRIVRDCFPAPLALLYDAYFKSDERVFMELLVIESLRFASLLALQDSVIHRIFGHRSADRNERIQVLARPEKPGDWHSLLRQACLSDVSGRGTRFIPEFEGWERKCNQTLAGLVHAAAALSRPRGDSGQILFESRKALGSFLADLDFLRRYVLLAVTAVDLPTGRCAAQVLRGLASRSLEFVQDPRLTLRPEAGHLYLLSIDRRSALCLTPAFSYNKSGNGGGQWQVCGWSSWNDEVALQLEVKAFDASDQPVPYEPPRLRSILTGWLGPELCFSAFRFQEEPGPIVNEGKLLDDDSWEQLLALVLPEGGAPEVLAGRFRLDGAPVHRGLHADLFAATDISPERAGVIIPEQPLVHVLHRDDAAEEAGRQWFAKRAECWRSVEHPQVLKIYEASDAPGRAGLPFLLTDRVKDGRSLEQLLQSGGRLSEALVTQAMILAIEACQAAHQRGVLLLALPPRHFIVDDKGHLYLTGFETAIGAEFGKECPASLENDLRRYSKDFEAMAPELKHGCGMLAPTVDVFAIGRLLARIRELPQYGPLDLLPTGDWGDPWQCLAYHCVARDPNMRFQSADQILIFLKQWLRCDEPQTVAVPPTATGPGFSLGKYPVTNREYQRFCHERDRMPPPHLGARGWQNEEKEDDPLRRLNGPWLPVTQVNLLDGEAYCQWLSERTRQKWRLPKENEWMQAAGGAADHLYPWGSEAPDRRRVNYDRYYRGPTVVGAFPNSRSDAGCWDMAGNVWEWCEDIVKSGAPRRVVKGGAYDYSSEALQLSSRDARVVTCRSPHVGFRVLCEEKII